MHKFPLIIEVVLWHREWLAHLFEESVSSVNSSVNRHILGAHLHLVLDPYRELVHFVASLEPRVGEYHHSIIVLASEDAANAL